MKTSRFLLAGLLAAWPALTIASETGSDEMAVAAQFTSRRHSDLGPLSELEHLAPAKMVPRGARNIAYVDEEVRVGATRGRWAISALARNFAVLTATASSVDFARHAAGERAATDQQWSVDARFRGFRGFGAELARDFRLSEALHGSLAASLLAVDRWRDYQASGNAAYTAVNGYAFDLRTSSLSEKLQFAQFQQPTAPHGTALLLSGGLSWLREPCSAGVDVRDAGWVYWPRLPRQQLDLTSNTKQIDADGFVVYRPLLLGVNSQADASHAAPWRWIVHGSCDARAQGKFTAVAEYIGGFGALPRLEWRQQWRDALALLAWSVHERRLTVGMEWRGVRFQLGADRLGSGAHSREAVLSWSVPL